MVPPRAPDARELIPPQPPAVTGQVPAQPQPEGPSLILRRHWLIQSPPTWAKSSSANAAGCLTWPGPALPLHPMGMGQWKEP